MQMRDGNVWCGYLRAASCVTCPSALPAHSHPPHLPRDDLSPAYPRENACHPNSWVPSGKAIQATQTQWDGLSWLYAELESLCNKTTGKFWLVFFGGVRFVRSWFCGFVLFSFLYEPASSVPRGDRKQIFIYEVSVAPCRSVSSFFVHGDVEKSPQIPLAPVNCHCVSNTSCTGEYRVNRLNGGSQQPTQWTSTSGAVNTASFIKPVVSYLLQKHLYRRNPAAGGMLRFPFSLVRILQSS